MLFSDLLLFLLVGNIAFNESESLFYFLVAGSDQSHHGILIGIFADLLNSHPVQIIEVEIAK